MSVQYGEIIRKWCGIRGMSVTQLAKKANISSVGMWKLLNGDTSNPAITTIEAIANALKISPLVFFSDKASKTQEGISRNIETVDDLCTALHGTSSLSLGYENCIGQVVFIKKNNLKVGRQITAITLDEKDMIKSVTIGDTEYDTDELRDCMIYRNNQWIPLGIPQ